MLRLSFYPIGDSYLLVVTAAIVLLVLLSVGPVRGGLGRRRVVLVGIRLAVIALVILAMLRPTLVYTEIRKQPATLVVLIDKSRSMSVPDAIGGMTRWEALRRALDDGQDALAAIAEDFEVKVYAFGAEADPVDLVDGEIRLEEIPGGKQTAIGAVLEDVLRREAGKRLLGVILLSDGAQRAYAPRDLPPQTAVAQMKPLGSPLFTFPFGQARGLGQAQDVAVADLLADQQVYVKNELEISGRIRVHGYVNRDIPLRLLFETAPGKMEVVVQENLRPTADGQVIPFKLSYAPQVPGEYRLTVEATEQPGELATTNNRLSTFVNVLAGGLKVSYLEGALRVEPRFICEALDASADINVDYLRIDARRPQTRPGNLAERFAPGKYEVHILGDLDSLAFRGAELKSLVEAVSRGAGLIMIGGYHSFGPGGYGKTPLAEVLPIQIGAHERQSFGEKIADDLHLSGPLRMQPSKIGMGHFSLMLAGSPQENLAAWNRLPPLGGANRFAGLKRGALPLAIDQKNRPLLVAQAYGAGRVMAFAGDTTWRWWMRGFEASHKRFWRQIVLWLARKDESAQGNVWIKLPRRRFGPGQRVEFSAGAKSATGQPLADATFEAQIVLPDGKTGPLRLSRQEDHRIGSFGDTQAAGDYAVSVTAQHEGQLLGTVQSRFLVYQQDLELDNASADVTAMQSLAAMTGGQSLAPEQLSELLEQLAQDTERLEDHAETKRTLWDTWPFFLLLVGLLGIDWYLRKRWGLV